MAVLVHGPNRLVFLKQTSETKIQPTLNEQRLQSLKGN